MIAYLDTSSLVKLYVSESGSDAVRELVDAAAAVATSQLAYPETRAALARRRRERTLSAHAFRAATRSFESDWPRYLAISVTPELCREAGELAERYRLRAYDSVQLASFAEIARESDSAAVRFSSFDEALNRAARAYHRARTREGRRRAG